MNPSSSVGGAVVGPRCRTKSVNFAESVSGPPHSRNAGWPAAHVDVSDSTRFIVCNAPQFFGHCKAAPMLFLELLLGTILTFEKECDRDLVRYNSRRDRWKLGGWLFAASVKRQYRVRCAMSCREAWPSHVQRGRFCKLITHREVLGWLVRKKGYVVHV